MGEGELPKCQSERMGASDYHHSVIRTDDGSVQCRPQCLPAYERTHNHFIGQYSAIVIWIPVGVTSSVILYLLLYISQSLDTDLEWADWSVGLSLSRDLEEPEMRIAERIEIVEHVHPDINAVEWAGKYDAIAHIEIVESVLHHLRVWIPNVSFSIIITGNRGQPTGNR